jgi:hypothetical protein
VSRPVSPRALHGSLLDCRTAEQLAGYNAWSLSTGIWRRWSTLIGLYLVSAVVIAVSR